MEISEKYVGFSGSGLQTFPIKGGAQVMVHQFLFGQSDADSLGSKSAIIVHAESCEKTSWLTKNSSL
jgi:hypothetical protein